jgi:hypothetical protein
MSMSHLTAVAALLAAALAPAMRPDSARAQTGGGALTFAQIEQRFDGMNEIHIAKCDRNGDGLIERNEYPCVQGIYQVMYKQRR